MSPIKKHFFVCVHENPPGSKPSCKNKNAYNIYLKLIEEVQKRKLYNEILVTASGCLGLCYDGVVIVVYPEGTWYVNVTDSDVNEIAQKHMEKGIIVERLALNWYEE